MSATIRTRLGSDRILERLAEFVRDRGPRMNTLFSTGYVAGGVVDPEGFRLVYCLKQGRQFSGTHSVHGTIQDTNDWRLVHLSTQPNTRWIRDWVVVMGSLLFVGVLAPIIYVGWFPPSYLVLLAAVGAGLTLLLFVSLFGIPRLVIHRVSRLVANELDGSILRRGRWKVPRGPGWW